MGFAVALVDLIGQYMQLFGKCHVICANDGTAKHPGRQYLVCSACNVLVIPQCWYLSCVSIIADLTSDNGKTTLCVLSDR